MDPGVIAVIGLCIFLVLWYGGGHLYNRRRGQHLFRWLETGLDALGGEREAGWVGSPASGARVNVVHAEAPFRRLEITLLLESREVLPLWLVDRLRGKRDRLIIKATLRSPRHGELEVIPATRSSVIRGEEQSWTRQDGPHGLVVAHRGSGAERQVAALEPWLEAYGTHLSRFSWRKTDPHVQLQMSLSGLATASCGSFLVDLQAALGKNDAH